MTAAGTKEAATGADAYLHSLAYHQLSCSICYHPRGDKVASSWGDFLWMASLALSGTSCDSTKQPQIWQCCSNPPVLLPPRRSVVCREPCAWVFGALLRIEDDSLAVAVYS